MILHNSFERVVESIDFLKLSYGEFFYKVDVEISELHDIRIEYKTNFVLIKRGGI